MSPCPGRPHAIDLLRGELTPAEADEARRHLMACEACAQEAVSVGELRAVLEKAPRVDPSRAFVGKVLAAVEGEKVVRRSAWRLWASRPGPAWGISFAFHAAAFAILAFLFYAQIKERPGEGAKPLPGPAAPALAVEPEHAKWFDLSRREEVAREWLLQASGHILEASHWLRERENEVRQSTRNWRIRDLTSGGEHPVRGLPWAVGLGAPGPVAPDPVVLALTALGSGADGSLSEREQGRHLLAVTVASLLVVQSPAGDWPLGAPPGDSPVALAAWAVLALRWADSFDLHFVHDALSRACAWAESLPDDTIYKRFILDRPENLPAPRDEQEAFFAALLGADVSYLLDQQAEDGSWGGDVERTLYAVLALQAPCLYPRPID